MTRQIRGAIIGLLCLCAAVNLVKGSCLSITFVNRDSNGWDASSPTSTTTLSTPVAKAVVHHTDTPRCYSKTSCSSRVRSIQNHHMNNNGWSDIGYNFLIGGDGRVYVGRGWTRQGAHATGHNSHSIGISFIGTYTSSSAPSGMLTTLSNLLSCGVSLSRLSSNYQIRGHRDVGSTTCPGNALYNQISTWSRFQS